MLVNGTQHMQANNKANSIYIYIVSVLFDYGIYVLLVTSIAAVFLTTKKFKCQI